MKFKYYLRGIGIGIMLATLLLTISFYFGKDGLAKRELTDEEIIARATQLGMVMSDSLDEKPEETDKDSEDNTEVTESTDDTEATESTDDTSSETQAADATKTEESSEDTQSTTESTESESKVTYVPFTVKSGESSDTVAYNLYKAGLVDSSSGFNTYMNGLGVDNRIQSGTFYVKSGSSYDDLIALLVNKDTRSTTPPRE